MTIIVDLVGFERIELLSPLAPEECIRRLQEAAMPGGVLGSALLKLRVYRARPWRPSPVVLIRKRRSLDPRAHVFMACRIRVADGATRIVADFHVFGILMRLFAMAAPVYMMLHSYAQGMPSSLLWFGLAMAAAAIAFFRPDTGKERTLFLAVLRNAVDAREVSRHRD